MRTKIVFVITTGTEARLIAPVYRELIRRAVAVTNISTGSLCCDASGEQPETAMDTQDMTYTPLSGNTVTLLRQENPDLVVVGGDQEYIRRSFLYAADGLCIPTLLLQVGISSNTYNIPRIAIQRTVYRLKHHGLNIIRKYLCLLRTTVALRWSPLRITKMILTDINIAFTVDDANGRFGRRAVAVSCQWQKGTMVARGISPEMITVTGNPLIQVVNDQKREGSIRYRLEIDKDDRIILFLTCAQVEHGRWLPSTREGFVKGALDTISQLADRTTKIVIKIHPMESLEDYEGVVGNRANVILCKDIPLAPAVSDSDFVVVGGYSTAILETCIYHKPMLILNISGEVEEVPYEDMGIAVNVNSLSELHDWTAALINNPETREQLSNKAKAFCEANVELVDGKATGRISDLIEELAKTHRRMR